MDASHSASPIYLCSCLACLAALLPLYNADGDLAADVASLCLDAAMRLGSPVAARRAKDCASVPLRCARTEALFLAAALAGQLDARATAALARKLFAVADPSDGLAAAAPALSELLAQLHSGRDAQDCAADVMYAAFMQQHWALVHAAADGFVRLCRCARLPAGAAPPRSLLPTKGAVGDQAALKRLVNATVARVAPSTRAAAPALLETQAEAEALEEDANLLYVACCAAA